MYINSEKDLEDYICNHTKEFIRFLKELYKYDNINVDKIQFVGRQIVIGDSRLDLLFEIQEEIDDKLFEVIKTYIAVELKYRKAEPKDIAQLSRYLNLLNSLEGDERIGNTMVKAKEILLTTGLNNEVQDMQMYFNDYTDADIKFVHINTKIDFEEDSYYYRDDFLENMIVDNRLKRINQEVTECGKKTND